MNGSKIPPPSISGNIVSRLGSLLISAVSITASAAASSAASARSRSLFVNLSIERRASMVSSLNRDIKPGNSAIEDIASSICFASSDVIIPSSSAALTTSLKFINACTPSIPIFLNSDSPSLVKISKLKKQRVVKFL
ncbi:MAG: hypothetical protein IID03_10550 [Candidatus Dadabacteria bacterium]|nr:hypothetical protein [Candidatus Dadabacteria bacterium]